MKEQGACDAEAAAAAEILFNPYIDEEQTSIVEGLFGKALPESLKELPAEIFTADTAALCAKSYAFGVEEGRLIVHFLFELGKLRKQIMGDTSDEIRNYLLKTGAAAEDAAWVAGVLS